MVFLSGLTAFGIFTMLSARMAQAASSSITSTSNSSATSTVSYDYYNTNLPSPIFVSPLGWGMSSAGDGVVGSLHKPAEGGDADKAAVLVLVMHAQSDYTNFYPCYELPYRGFTALCANNAASKEGSETDGDLSWLLSDLGLMVAWARNQTEYKKIVLWGHSGGGCLVTAYQNIAEHGAAACNGSEKIIPCTAEDVEGLEPADGVISHDANFGLSTMTFLSMNPAVVNETNDSFDIDESVNLYDEAYGFNASGPSDFSEAFLERYQKAVVKRNNQIIDAALDRWNIISQENGTGLKYNDDEPLVIADSAYSQSENKIFTEDLKFLSHTTSEWPVIHNNGSIITQIAKSVRVSLSPTSSANSYSEGALKTTVKAFLDIFAIRVTEDFSYQEDGFTGIVWNSSHMVPVNEAVGITVPLLTLGNLGSFEYVNAEKIHLAAVNSNDTAIAFIDGAEHTINPCTECATYDGEYNNTVKNAFDFTASWLSEPGRFIAG